MRVIVRIMLVATFFTLTLSGILEPATFCDQTFTIYGKTAGEHSIIMWELFVGGECYFWEAYALFVGHGEPTLLSSGYDPDGAEWMAAFLDGLPTEHPVTIPDSNGTIFIGDSVRVETPPTDTAIPAVWRELYPQGAYDAKEWNKRCRDDTNLTCMDQPIFAGAAAKLLYYYVNGFYKNYSFKEAIWFPESGYLVIKTHQPMELIGGDSMHGLLIYRLKKLIIK